MAGTSITALIQLLWLQLGLKASVALVLLDKMEAQPERYPLLRLARRVDHLLRPGEVLLVPGGAPHRVRNGESDDDERVSIAIAANFVDGSNCAGALADLQLMARRNADASKPAGLRTLLLRPIARMVIDGRAASASLSAHTALLSGG